MMDKVTVKNKYGVTVVCCCASCKHKLFKDDKTRDCALGERGVKPSYLCSSWMMEPHLDEAGRGDGRIRRGEYLKFILKNGGKTDGLIAFYESKYGSRFLTK